MSTTETETAAPTRLRLDQIIDRGGNPRGAVDLQSEAFAELVASIELNGVVQPILVARVDEGLYPVIAGHRRFAAASRAGHEDIPVLVAGYAHDSTEAKIAAIAENVNRLNLSPLQEARGIEDLRGIGLSQKEAGAAFGKSERWARDAELLLKLPKGVAAGFDAGAIAASATRPLQQVAEKAPRMAELLAQLAIPAAKESSTPQYGPKGSVARAVAHLASRGLDPEKDGTSPVGCFVDAESGIDYDDVVLAGIAHGKLKEWKPRFEALGKRLDTAGYYGPGPQPELTPADLDAARSYGCLLELDGLDRFNKPIVLRYVTDAKWLADRIPDALERAEAARKQKESARTPARVDGGSPAGSRHQPTAEEREARKQAREAERERKETARLANLELGQRADRAYEAPEPTLEEAKAIAALAFYTQINSIAGANAYAYHEFQKEDPKNPGELIYTDGYTVEKAIWEALEACTSPQQVWGLLLRSTVVAAYTDPTVERLESRQSTWAIPGDRERVADDTLSRTPERIRASALARKVVPDAVLKREREREREAKAEEKRKANSRVGSVLEALAAGKKGGTPAKVSSRTYNRAKKDVFSAGVYNTAVQEILDSAVKRKEATRDGAAGDPKATYTITAKGKEKLAALAEGEKGAAVNG